MRHYNHPAAAGVTHTRNARGARRRLLAAAALTGAALLGGCAVNPVTGEHQIRITSPEREVAIGTEQYGPAQQAAGGQYYLDPELNFYVKSVGEKLARVSDRPGLPYDFVIIDSSVPNAWALPGGKIAVNRGLLTQLKDESQLAAVLGHEIVHAAAGHSAQKMDRDLMTSIGAAALGVAVGDREYGNLILGGAAVGTAMLSSRYSREQELEADKYGMKYMAKAGYDPQGAVELQETFVKLDAARNQSWLNGLFASHPPSPERVAANRETAAHLPAGGVRNTAGYHRHIAKLEHDAPAYAAYDRGAAALKGGDPAAALKAADAAIAIEPEGSRFYELKGRALETQGKLQPALAAYNRAIALDSHYFSPLLRRGLLRRKLGDTAGASRDLHESNQLLPTATASYGLGLLALADNDRDSAVRYLQAAAGAGGTTGAAAQRQLAMMQLAERPAALVPARLFLRTDGELVVAVANRSPVAVRRVTVEIGRISGGGYTPVKRIELSGAVAPGTISEQRRTGVYPPLIDAAGYQARVIHAEAAP